MIESARRIVNTEVDVESWSGPQQILPDLKQFQRGGHWLRRLRKYVIKRKELEAQWITELRKADGKTPYEPPRLTVINLRPEEAVLGHCKSTTSSGPTPRPASLWRLFDRLVE